MPSDKRRSVRYTHEFKRNLRLLSRRYRHIRSDLEPVIQAIQQGETPGVRIPGINYRVFKVRCRNTDAQKGKRGGYRLIYSLPSATEAVLITVYSKSDQGDVSLQKLRQIIEESLP